MSKHNDYLDSAAETVRLAQHASSSSAKTRLLHLAEAWVVLAKKAHDLKMRQPIEMHPLPTKKMDCRQ